MSTFFTCVLTVAGPEVPSGSTATDGTTVRYIVGVYSRKYLYIRIQNTHFMRNLKKDRFALINALCGYFSKVLRIYFPQWNATFCDIV